MKHLQQDPHPARRRGFYATLIALSIFVMFGFGALAVDVSYMRLSQSQAQDVADAASQAAAIILRRTNDPSKAEAISERVVSMNKVGGAPPQIEGFTFGTWAEAEGVRGSFTPGTLDPNAVRVSVGRRGNTAIPLLLAPVLGYDNFAVRASATSASRNVHVVLVMDITNSWNPKNFEYARAAAVRFFDTMSASAGPYDKIGMSVFTGRYGWEFTPLTRMRDAEALGIRDQWAEMKTASKSGTGTNWPSTCSTNTTNNFNSPVGGCYPNMPREYTDEPGTDHTTGIEMASLMFDTDTDPAAERVMVVLTDGIPNGLSSGHGTLRQNQGYVESRWREYKGPVPHSTSQVQTKSNALTAELWSRMRVHTYVISFVQDGSFMHTMPKGQGYYTLTSSASAIVEIFEDIANSLPLAIVE